MTISSFSAENSLETAEFLLKHEIKCVSLIQKLKDSPSEVFIFRNTKTNAIAGIISVSAGGSILHCLPDLQVIVAAEKLILTLVKNRTLFCINGEKKASQALADFFYSHGFQKPKIINNYILMNRKSSVIPEKCNSNGLIFKKCTENDAKFLLPLELAYQKEEVLTDSQKINPAVCSYSLMRRLKTQIVFSAVKILFSTEKEKEHFKSYDSNNESLYILKNDSHKEKEGLINRINNIFDCCISRKKDKESTKNNKYISSIFKDNSKNIYNNKISLSLLIEEIEDGVHFIISDSEREDKENVISIWWIILIVSSYCKLYPSIKGNFHLNVFSLEPKVIIKKAKEIDEYLAYIMYIQWKYLTEGNFYLTEMKNVLDELFRKNPHRIEGYLFYWEFLTKSSLKEYYKALQISQTVYSQLNVLDDNELYFYYVVITYSKSLMYNGKYSQIMRLLKQEFYHNLSYTSLYLYLGIILAKSKAKTLLSESVSILTNTSSLVYTDLKFLSYYWIGYVYYSLVDYINCYKYWKKCHASNYKYSNKKTVYIEKFISKYKNVFNNLNDIKQSQFIESATKIKSMIRRNQSLYAFCDYVILKYRLLQSMKIEDFEREYISLLVHYPNIEKFYYAFWKELKKRNKISLLITFSFYMLLFPSQYY